MKTNAFPIVLLSLLALAAVGCASGPMAGQVAVAGEPRVPLTMSWESGLFGGSGTMTAVMPDGERFSGKYTVVKKDLVRGSIGSAWTGDDPPEIRGAIDDSMWGAARDSGTFLRTHENKAIATLKGNRGTTMLCRFELDASEAGMRGVGAGTCQTSQGAQISATY